MKNLDITAVAKRAGLPASTLRFYEEKGLIRSIGRVGLRRVFDHRVLDRLALIALGRTAGFSLEEMAGMFAPDGKPRIDKRVLAAKADELDHTIRKLSAIREGLRHAAVCKASSHMECPTFQRILRVTRKRSGDIHRSGRNKLTRTAKRTQAGRLLQPKR